MPLQGTFDVLDFTEVLHLLSQQELTGRLHVRSRSFGAHLFLEDGLLVGADQSEHQPAATAGDVRGRIEEVCFEMLEAERGSFEFHAGKPSTLPVGERFKTDEVLAQARRRLDEWHELQELIPSLDLQPRLVLDLSRTEVTLDRERWRMLTTIDGRRNLRAIGRALNLSDFDVCRVLRTLLEDGIVQLDGYASLPASTRDAMPVVPAPDGPGLERVTPVGGDDAETIAFPRPDGPGDGDAVDGAPLAEPAPLAPAADETVVSETGVSEPETPAEGVEVVPAATDETIVLPALGGDAAEPAEAAAAEGGDGRRGRRVIRIRSRQED